jgi:hypothetical protein
MRCVDFTASVLEIYLGVCFPLMNQVSTCTNREKDRERPADAEVS